jgi:drug/metabolite transporter (DMT)-like permease
MNARVTTPLSLFIGSLMMLPVIAIKGTSFAVERMNVLGWVGILYLGVAAVGLAYLLYFVGLESMGVSRGSSFIYLKPTIAALLAWPFLSEVPTIVTIISILLISFSVYLVVAEAGLKRILKWKNGTGRGSGPNETDPKLIQSTQDRIV